MRLCLLTLTLALAAPALAAPRPDPNKLPTRPVLTATPAALLVAGMDANQDGRVTRAEMRAAAERMFAVADADHDGAIGLIELADWSQAWLGDQSAVPGRFDFDRNGDDKISKAEFRRGDRTAFRRLRQEQRRRRRPLRTDLDRPGPFAGPAAEPGTAASASPGRKRVARQPVWALTRRR